MYVQPVPVVECVTPTSAVTCAHATSVVEHVTPTLSVAYVAPVTTRTVASTVFPTSTAPIISVPIEVRCCNPSARSVDIPVVAQKQFPVVREIHKTIVIPQLHYIDKVVDVTVCRLCRYIGKVVDVPHGAGCAGSTGAGRGRTIEIADRWKIVEIPEIHTVQGVKTCERLSTALVRYLAQAEIVEDVEIGRKAVHGWPSGPSTDGLQGRPRMALRAVHGWPSTDGPRSSPDGQRPSTDGPRFSFQAVHGWREFRNREAAMCHCTSKWQRGPPPPGCLRMAHRSSADNPTRARTGGAAPGATTGADGRVSAGDLGGRTVSVHRQGCRLFCWC